MYERVCLLKGLAALQIALLAVAATSPALAKHHHSAVSSRHSGDSGKNAAGAETSGAPKNAPSAVPQGRDTNDADNTHVKFGVTMGRDGAKGGNGEASPHGGDHAVSKGTGFGNEPIDASITVVGSPRSKHGGWSLDLKKAKAGKIGKNDSNGGLFGHHRDRVQLRGKANRVVTNAIGVSVTLPRSRKTPDVQVSAPPGLPKPPNDSDASLGGFPPGSARQVFIPAPARTSKPLESPINAAAPATPMSINGRGMIRPGSKVGVIGGPNQMTAGVVRGSDFHPKIP